MELRSPAFENNTPIPARYTGDGDNIAPPLEWREAPEGTKSFALVMEDPDAPNGTFRHWAVYDIAGERDRLPEATTNGAKTERLGLGVNDFDNTHYDGPAPPKGHGTHHYHFKLAALDVDHLTVAQPPTVEAVWEAARQHALATAEIVGTYER